MLSLRFELGRSLGNICLTLEKIPVPEKSQNLFEITQKPAAQPHLLIFRLRFPLYCITSVCLSTYLSVSFGLGAFLFLSLQF